MILIYIISFLVVCVLLAYSGASLVKSLNRMSIFLGLSGFSIAFVLMSFATSLPEFFVGITSALKGTPELSLGNLLGANIINLTLSMGLITFFARGVPVKGKYLFGNLLASLGVALLPFLLLFDQKLSRLDGGILLAAFLVYIITLLSRRKKTKEKEDEVGLKEFFKNLLFFFLGIGVLLFSAWVLVYFATKIATSLNLSLVFIGLIGVALGTSLPEFTFGLRAQRSEHKEMNLGNILGSIVVNVSLILGIVSLISPISIYPSRSFIFTGFSPSLFLFSFLSFLGLARCFPGQKGYSLLSCISFLSSCRFWAGLDILNQ